MKTATIHGMYKLTKSRIKASDLELSEFLAKSTARAKDVRDHIGVRGFDQTVLSPQICSVF